MSVRPALASFSSTPAALLHSASPGLALTFELSPGESTGITSRFEVVPGPTTALMVGVDLCGLGWSARRRA